MPRSPLLAAALATLSLAARANNPVSATPGTISGVVRFHAPFVPDSLEVDARDATNTYTATTRPFGAQQNDPAACAQGSENWCYSIIVESALAHDYSLRPIAYRNGPVHFGRVPFAPSAPVHLNAGDAVAAPPIDFTPAEIPGAVTAADLSSAPLALKSTYFSANDLDNTVNEACVGSADGCPFNPVSNDAGGTFDLFLQPGSHYHLLTQAFSVDEGAAAQSDISIDYNLPPVGPFAAGQIAPRNLSLHEIARVTGSALLPVPIYNVNLAVSATTLAGGSYAAQYRTLNYDGLGGQPLPAGATSYVGRIFDNVDLSKPVTLTPGFILAPGEVSQLYFPPVTLDFSQQSQIVRDFSGDYATIDGRVTFSPPYPTKNGVYPQVQAIESDATGYGQAYATYTTDALGGTFTLPAYGTPNFSGNWNLWRFGWNFDLGDPSYSSTLFVGNYLNVPVQVASGGSAQHDFQIPTALVKVFFSAPAGTTLTDPQLHGYSDDGDAMNAEGLGQDAVLTGQARLVMRANHGAVHLTPSATINPGGIQGTSRTDFSPITLFPQQGDVTVVGVPGSIALTLSAPAEGQVFDVCSIPVAGLSTGQPGIGITVNGASVPAPLTGNPGDPLQVSFTTTLTPAPGPLTITVVASDGNGHSVSDARHVSCLHPLNSPPVVTCAPAVFACQSHGGGQGSMTVALSDLDGDALQVTWKVDGAVVKSSTVSGPADTYSGLFAPYGHSVVVTADDGKGGTASCSTTASVPNPVVSTSVVTSQLSPPNHTLTDVGWKFNVADKCANVATRVVQVFSNEADVVAGIDGQYSPDAKVKNVPGTQVPQSVRLRNERAASGRVYLILHTVTDVNGHVGWSCQGVTVPVDLTPGNVAAVNAAAAAAVASCAASGAAPAGYVQVGPGPQLGPYQ